MRNKHVLLPAMTGIATVFLMVPAVGMALGLAGLVCGAVVEMRRPG